MKYQDRRNSFYIGAIIAIIIIGYAGSRFWGFLEGPSINITSPENGATVESPLLFVNADTKYIAFITMNDRQIYIDENGRLSEQLLLQNGYNIISIKATDRFGRKVEKRLELFYKPKE